MATKYVCKYDANGWYCTCGEDGLAASMREASRAAIEHLQAHKLERAQAARETIHLWPRARKRE